MSKVQLTAEEKRELESRHKKVREGRERDRIKAVLLSAEGWSTLKIAQAWRKHESSIVHHLNDFIRDGKLSSDSGGSDGYLNDEDTQRLIGHLGENTYLHTHQIVAYIKTTFDVEYTVSGLNKGLHQHDFSYKKPKGVPHKFDVEKQAAFIEHYETLKAALNDDEPLLFMDAVHPTQATKITAGGIKKGVDKPIETSGSRTRLNIIGAIRLGHFAEAITAQYKTVKGESIVAFLERTRAFYPSSNTIHLILEGAGYHRSLLVVEAAEKLNIKLHYLPPYSPKLNPIERLWKVMNKHARNSRYFATAKEFREQIDRFFTTTLPDIAGSLDSTINDNFQILESAVWSCLGIDDAMMSGFACLYFQDPSLLQFQKRLEEERHSNNLKTRYDVNAIPSNTQWREIVDPQDSGWFTPVAKKYVSRLQRGKQLEALQLFPGKYVCSIDATPYFSSQSIHNARSLTKHHRDGTTPYQRFALQAALMHPDSKQVIPVAAEDIYNIDGNTQQDCETNAGKRLIPVLQATYPKLGLIITGDDLFSRQPTIEAVLAAGKTTIFVAKPSSHQSMFEGLAVYEHLNPRRIETREGHILYQWMNDVPLHGGENVMRVTEDSWERRRREWKTCFWKQRGDGHGGNTRKRVYPGTGRSLPLEDWKRVL